VRRTVVHSRADVQLCLRRSYSGSHQTYGVEEEAWSDGEDMSFIVET
jgi:hypothetical protein